MPDPLYFFGHSLTGEASRQLDWSGSTALGDPASWPDDLKVILGMMYANRQPVCLFWGRDHTYFYNDAYIPIVGESKHPQAIGQSGAKVWREVWDILFPQIRQVLDRGESTWNVDQYIPIIGKQGELRDAYFTYSYSPVFLSTGEINGVLVTCTETTAKVLSLREMAKTQARLEKSEEQLTQAVDFAKVGFYDWDVQNDVIVFSPQMQADWGIQAGKDLNDIVQSMHPEDRERVTKLIAGAMETRSFYETEYRVVRPDGAVIWIEAKGQITYDGKGQPLRFFGTSQNVTERKIAELHLAQERQKLEQAVNVRDQFLSIASHELKTPLTSVQLQTQVIKRNIQLQKPDALEANKIVKFVNLTDRSVARLSRLVDDMLDISRIASGKLTLVSDRFDLCQLGQEVIERLQPQAEMFNVRLLLLQDGPVQGVWDKFRIEQVMNNLISNGIKYGQGSPVEMKIAYSSARDKAILSVQDHGPGIAIGNQERVFEIFERATNPNNVSGLGLGLYISKDIVERHHGTISVKSEPGKGATFVVELPLNASLGPIKDFV